MAHSNSLKSDKIWRHVPLLLGAALLLSFSPQARAQETIGGGTITSPAVGPAPSYGIGGPNMVLVKNWHFGADGTIKNYADMSANFYYHDQFGTIGNGTNYGAVTVAPDSADALYNQPIEGVNSPPVRQFTTDSLQTFLTPLNGATTVDPNLHNAGNGSFMAKWNLPNGGSLLGQDIVWETRVRYVTPPYFWFALWTVGNSWHNGAEQDLIESFGYDNGGGYTNFDGRYWHSNSVGGSDTVNYSNWGNAMAAQGIPSYDATQYHIWTWVYKKDNSYAMYVDGVKVQGGANYNWTDGATAGGTPVNMDFLFDAGWGHTQVQSVDHTLPASAFAGKYYEFNYSRVYLSAPEAAFNGPHNVPGTTQASDYDTGGQGVAYSAAQAGGSYSSYRPADLVAMEGCSEGGYDVGWTGAGNWLKYTVNVGAAGTYPVTFRVSSGASGGSFHLQNASGNNLTGSVAVPGTGGWQNWVNVTANVTLPAGPQVLELYEDTGGYNIEKMTFAASGGAAPIGRRIGIKSSQTGYFTSSDQNDSTYLKALWSTSPGTWEVFDVVDAGGGNVALLCEQTGKYVTADANQASRVLRADLASTIGPWETFQWANQGGGVFGLKAADGLYVSCNLSDGDRLEAQWAQSVGTWEQFTWADEGPVVGTGLITGTVFSDGAGPWNGNQANAAPAAFDGNVNTFYDCANNAGYVGIDAGTAKTVSKIVFAPRPVWEGRMVGGVFEGSNTSATAGYSTLGTVTITPSDGLTNTLTVSSGTPYRWLRYRDSQGGNCNVAEIQFIN